MEHFEKKMQFQKIKLPYQMLDSLKQQQFVMNNRREKESPHINNGHNENRIEPIESEHIRPSIANQHHQVSLPPLKDQNHHLQPNPYEMNDNPDAFSQPQNHANFPPSPMINPYIVDDNPFHDAPQNHEAPTVIHSGDQVIVVPPGQQVIIVNQRAKEPQYVRQQRIGWCCFSVHHDTWCCNILCMNSFCRCIQGNNLFCYCHNCDCVFHCLGHCIRHMCESQDCLGCIQQCCRHMPLCMLIECCKDRGCGECLCNCLSNCNICECLGRACENCDCIGHICSNCDCNCLSSGCQGIGGCVCGILGAIFNC